MREITLFWRKRSKNINYIFIIFLFMISVIGAFIIKDYYQDRILNGPGKYLENRTYVFYDIDSDVFKDIIYIEAILPKYDNEIGYINNKLVTINYSNDLKNKEIYINKKLDKLASNVTIKVEGKDYSFEVKSNSLYSDADIYISKNLFEKIFDLIPTNYYVIIDNYYRNAEFKEYLSKKNIDNYMVYNSRLNEIRVLEKEANVFNIIVGIIIVISIILLLFTYFSIINNEYQDILIFKILGYSNFNIFKYLINIISLFVLCVFILLGFALIIFRYISSFINNSIFMFMREKLFLDYMVICLAGAFIVGLIAIFHNLIILRKTNFIASLEND